VSAALGVDVLGIRGAEGVEPVPPGLTWANAVNVKRKQLKLRALGDLMNMASLSDYWLQLLCIGSSLDGTGHITPSEAVPETEILHFSSWYVA
jgi:hypothetical protein